MNYQEHALYKEFSEKSPISYHFQKIKRGTNEGGKTEL